MGAHALEIQLHEVSVRGQARARLGEQHVAAQRQPLDALATIAHVRDEQPHAPVAMDPRSQRGEGRVVGGVVVEDKHGGGESVGGCGVQHCVHVRDRVVGESAGDAACAPDNQQRGRRGARPLRASLVDGSAVGDALAAVPPPTIVCAHPLDGGELPQLLHRESSLRRARAAHTFLANFPAANKGARMQSVGREENAYYIVVVEAAGSAGRTGAFKRRFVFLLEGVPANDI